MELDHARLSDGVAPRTQTKPSPFGAVILYFRCFLPVLSATANPRLSSRRRSFFNFFFSSLLIHLTRYQIAETKSFLSNKMSGPGPIPNSIGPITHPRRSTRKLRHQAASKPIECVEIITGIHHRRRHAGGGKVRLVGVTQQPSITASAVATLYSVFSGPW